MTDIESMIIIIYIAASYKWNLKQLDIKAAYLNANLKGKVYVRIPI